MNVFASLTKKQVPIDPRFALLDQAEAEQDLLFKHNSQQEQQIIKEVEAREQEIRAWEAESWASLAAEENQAITGEHFCQVRDKEKELVDEFRNAEYALERETKALFKTLDDAELIQAVKIVKVEREPAGDLNLQDQLQERLRRRELMESEREAEKAWENRARCHRFWEQGGQREEAHSKRREHREQKMLADKALGDVYFAEYRAQVRERRCKASESDRFLRNVFGGDHNDLFDEEYNDAYQFYEHTHEPKVSRSGMNIDPYEILGISRSADAHTVKKAYRARCREYHPDLHPGDDCAEDRFKEIQQAYEMLSA